MIDRSIQKFQSILNKHGGPTFTNLFYVVVYPPAAGNNWGNSVMKELCYLAHSVSQPDKSFQTTSLTISGPPTTFPTYTTFNKVKVTFFNTGDYNARRFFDSWMNSIINPVSNELSFHSDYDGSMDIYRVSLDNKNNPYTMRLTEAYPTAVTSSELSWDSANAPESFSVDMDYRKAFYLTSGESFDTFKRNEETFKRMEHEVNAGVKDVSEAVVHIKPPEPTEPAANPNTEMTNRAADAKAR